LQWRRGLAQTLYGLSELMRRDFLAIILVVLIPVAQSAPTDNLDPLPPWNYEELVSRATRGIEEHELKSVRLLAWHTQEDDRPVRYDAALLWVNFTTPSRQEKWALVMMARHPLDQPPSDSWVASYQGHSWYPTVIFDSPPRNNDVYKFIGGHWDFEPDNNIREGTKLTDGQLNSVQSSGFRILAGAVRARTWREVIGEAPVRFHRGENPGGK
jgi:hypothetical protein